MLKKILLGLIIVVVTAAGILWFKMSRSTPEFAVKSFTTDLAKGKVDAAYARLTDDLTKEREVYWREYFKQFADEKSEPTFIKEDTVIDTFNTYTERQDPHRFHYMFHLKDRDYQMVILLVKEGSAWKIEELNGSGIPQ